MKTSYYLILFLFCSLFSFNTMNNSGLNKKLQKYCNGLGAEFDEIAAKRRDTLNAIGRYIVDRKKAGKEAQITVICTHNSRRSHMGQIWLQTAAEFYGISGIKTYSGGTEASTFNPRAVAALERAGFVINKEDSDEKNPVYTIQLGEGIEGVQAFSKKYTDTTNPQTEFAAILVCTQADEACPIVRGADGRFSLPYQDPKLFDGTGIESDKYDERCRQIAREMFYIMDFVSQNM